MGDIIEFKQRFSLTARQRELLRIHAWVCADMAYDASRNAATIPSTRPNGGTCSTGYRNAPTASPLCGDAE